MPNARAGDGSPTSASWDARRGELGPARSPKRSGVRYVAPSERAVQKDAPAQERTVLRDAPAQGDVGQLQSCRLRTGRAQRAKLC